MILAEDLSNPAFAVLRKILCHRETSTYLSHTGHVIIHTGDVELTDLEWEYLRAVKEQYRR